MFLKFLRRRRAEPLHVSMMGARMGERVLQIGCDDETLLAGVSVKVGLSGSTAALTCDDRERARAQQAGVDAGALIDIEQAALTDMPFPADAFDLVIVDDTAGRFAARTPEERLGAIREALRVLRPGGRIAIVEGLGGGRFGSAIARPDGYAGDALLREGGFHPVRLLAERERYRFYEGLKAVTART
jgi:SAM-dependent methyltransferase